MIFSGKNIKKNHEIKWLQDVNIIQCTDLSPYISGTDGVMGTCYLYLYLYYHIIISELTSFIKNLLLQNNEISVSIVKNSY